MAKIELDYKKNLEENASAYFDKSKKAKKKIEGLKEALDRFRQEIKELQEKNTDFIEEQSRKKILPKKSEHWYDSYRWFISSEGFLCIGGRDATQNEILIKKHTEPTDLVFHSEITGSPFFIIKTEKKTPGEATLQECAQITASYSRAWRRRLSSAEVYHITPEQVSKTANSGEYLTKGSFMIRGKRTQYHPSVKLTIGLHDGNIIAGTLASVSSKTNTHFTISPGEHKLSEAAKLLRKALKYEGHLDDIVKMIPSGKTSVEKARR
jgi:predicted ribosome quality control (RQC) complex YloA/Tae2 family protein